MDLLANFMGLVIIGGAGMMVMIGGAVVHASSGAAPFEQRCRGGRSIEAGELAFATSRDRRAPPARDVQGCTIEGRYNALVFPAGQPKAPDSIEVVRTQFCEDVYENVAFIKSHGLTGARVELVGRSSADFKATQQCGTTFSADRNLVDLCPECSPQTRDRILRAYAVGSDTDTAGSMDRYLCNAGLAARRAVWAFQICLDRTLKEPGGVRKLQASDMLDHVSLAAEPQTDEPRADVEQKRCAGNTPSCNRTVTVRLRLTPSRGGA